MSISKTIRFEVFKRDGFRCNYCGRTPPEVVLEADHIIPKSKGGPDDIANLICACFDCNRGKRDIPLEMMPSSIAENFELLQEKHAQIKEYEAFLKKLKRQENGKVSRIEKIFTTHFPGYVLNTTFKNVSVRKFLKDLPSPEVESAMEKACGYLEDRDDAIKYFCGICWRKIKGDGRERG